MGKITKFVDLDKPKSKNIKKSDSNRRGYPTSSSTSKSSKSSINILKKQKPQTNKALAESYTQKYLLKKEELESQIKNNITKNRGPQSKKELAKIKFDIQQVQFNNCSVEEKRKLERERLIKLGAKSPKTHLNYKEFQNKNKEDESKFQEKLSGFSMEEQIVLKSERNRKLKKEKDFKQKGDRRFFNLKNDGLKTSGMKVGKFKNGVVKLSRHEVNHM